MRRSRLTLPPIGWRNERPGRPRQADVEPRSYEAVLAVFGKHGWAGLSIDAVATHAGIGKSTAALADWPYPYFDANPHNFKGRCIAAWRPRA